jgi:hypothetical protein
LKNAKVEKSNMLLKRRKIKYVAGKWWKKGGKIKYEITIGLTSR